VSEHNLSEAQHCTFCPCDSYLKPHQHRFAIILYKEIIVVARQCIWRIASHIQHAYVCVTIFYIYHTTQVCLHLVQGDHHGCSTMHLKNSITHSTCVCVCVWLFSIYITQHRFATIPYEEIVMAGTQGTLSGDEVNALGFLRTPRLLRLGRCARPEHAWACMLRPG